MELAVFLPEISNIKCFNCIKITFFLLRSLKFWLQSQACSFSPSFKAFSVCVVFSLLLKEVGYDSFSSSRLRRSENPKSSLSGWLPNNWWCYFLHVKRDPCSVRHLPSNKRWWHLVFKCTDVFNELMTSKIYTLRGVMLLLFLMASLNCLPT